MARSSIATAMSLLMNEGSHIFGLVVSCKWCARYSSELTTVSTSGVIVSFSRFAFSVLAISAEGF